MKLRQKEQTNERCAVCKDGEGLVVCRGCGTLIHATCLLDVNGCPTLGCNELDPLQEKRGYEVNAHMAGIIDINDSPYSLEEMCLDVPSGQIVKLEKQKAELKDAVGKSKEEAASLRAELERQTITDFKRRAARAKKVRAAQSESYRRSLAVKLEEEAYDNETVCCESARCTEPTTRIERFCKLCMAEIDANIETGAGKTREERANVLENACKLFARERKLGLGVLWFFLSCAIGVCLMGIMDWLRS